MGIKATFSLNQIGAQLPSSEMVAMNAVVYVDEHGDLTLYPLQELYDRIQGAEGTLEDINNVYASTVNASQVNLSAVDLVRQYANKQVDVPVEQGYFSAKHWASKAEDAYFNTTVNLQGYIDSCQGILDNVQTKSEYIDTVYLNTVNDANNYLSQILDVYRDTDAIKTSVQGLESTVITKHNEVMINTNTVSNLHDVVVAAESNVTQLKADTQILKGQAASSASDAQAAQSATATMRDEVTALKESTESAANSAGSSLQSVTTLSDQVAQDASQVTSDKLAAQTAATNAQQSANAANAAKVSSEDILSDVTGLKSDVQSIAATLAGGIVMRGEWDASSGNAPPAPDGNSEFYKITVPGVINGITYDINDNIVYDPTNLVWFKVDNTESVTSVNGKTGVVTLTKVDVGLNQVDNTSDADKPVSSATQVALDGKLNNDYVPAWNSLTGKPSTFTPSTHGHPWTEITGKPSTFNPVAHNHTWNEVTGKPATATRWPTLNEIGLNNVDNTADLDKPVSTATQVALNSKLDDDYVPNWNVIEGKPATFAPSAHSHAWSGITGKPTTFTPSVHEHSWNQITGKPDTATRWPTLTEIGLNNVDNTSDIDKPISTATQAALNDKLPTSYVPSWSTITGKPATATRWPTKAEIGLGRVQDVRLNWSWGTGTITHIWGSQGSSTESYVYSPNALRDAMDIRWSDVTSKPVTATRWPTWNEVTGKPEQPVISSTVDRATLNDSTYLASGFYTTSQGLPNPTNSDVEESSWWHVLNFKHGHNNGYAAQLALELSSGTDAHLQFRTSGDSKNGDSWTNWYKVYSEQYKPTWDDIQSKPDLTQYTRNGSSVSLSGDVSGNARVNNDGSISITNTVVADDSHSHSNYVVKSSNATLNSLTTNQGLNVNGSLVQGTYKISNKGLTVAPNTTNYIYLGTYRTGIHELSFTTLGNSAYNNARYTLDICFDSRGNTKHQGTRIANSIIGAGATEFKGLLAVKVTSDKAALYLKYVTPNASQNIYFSVKSDATNGRHDLSETESWTIPNASNENEYFILGDFLNIDTYQGLTYGGSQVLTTSSGKAVDSDKLDGLDSSEFVRSKLANGYHGLSAPGNNDSNWIRTTINGLIPYSSGGASSLGTSAWPFSNIYANNIYDNGTLLENKYLGKNSKAVDSDKLDGLHENAFMRRTANSNLDMGTYNLLHKNPNNTNSVAEIGWENNYLRYRFGGSGETLGVRFDDYDSPRISLNRDGTIVNTSYTESAGFVSKGGTGLYLTAPGGGTYKNTSSTQTGYIKIGLPQSWTNTMMKFRVSVFDYAENESFDVIISGYNAQSGPFWTRTSATVISDNSVNRNFNVRFGHDGTKCAVYIGESNTTWGYPQIAVTEFHGGYTNLSADQWNDGWEISITTTLGTISTTQAGTELGRYIDNNTVWHAGNDGSGSGLDADLLDGLNSSSFLRSDTSDTFSRNNGIIQFSNTPGDVGNVSTGSRGPLEILQPTSGKDAFMTFHVAGDYAAYFGLDGSTNDLFVGGWSKGATKYKIWHQGNDGSGSGLDADFLRGKYLTSNATADTIALRDGSGHLRVNYLFGTYLNMSHGVSTRTSDTVFYSSQDSYIRKNDATGMRSSLNVPTRTGGNASGTWNISISGNANTVGGLSSSSLARRSGRTDGYIWARRDGNPPLYATQQGGGAIAEFRQGSGDGTVKLHIANKGDLISDGYGEFSGNKVKVIGDSPRVELSESGKVWFLIQDSGNFSIRETTTSGTRLQIFSGGFTRVYDGFDVYRGNLTVTAGTVTAHDVISTSDIRVKRDLVKIDNSLEKVKQLTGYTYGHKVLEERKAGIIAQDLDKVLPEGISTNKEGMLSVSPMSVIGLLVEAIKELSDELEVLKNG